MSNIPKSLQSILWSADTADLDLRRDKRYIIHQVLTYGSFADIHWLFDAYSKNDVVNVFRNHPSQSYPKKVFHFIKDFVLGLKNTQLDEQAYITSISGPVRPRAAKRMA